MVSVGTTGAGEESGGGVARELGRGDCKREGAAVVDGASRSRESESLPKIC